MKKTLGRYTEEYILEHSGFNKAAEELAEEIRKDLGLTLEELKKLEASYKRHGIKGCTCGETHSMECPEHISIHIEAQTRFPTSEPSMSLLVDHNKQRIKKK